MTAAGRGSISTSDHTARSALRSRSSAANPPCRPGTGRIEVGGGTDRTAPNRPAWDQCSTSGGAQRTSASPRMYVPPRRCETSISASARTVEAAPPAPTTSHPSSRRRPCGATEVTSPSAVARMTVTPSSTVAPRSADTLEPQAIQDRQSIGREQQCRASSFGLRHPIDELDIGTATAQQGRRRGSTHAGPNHDHRSVMEIHVDARRWLLQVRTRSLLRQSRTSAQTRVDEHRTRRQHSEHLVP